MSFCTRILTNYLQLFLVVALISVTQYSYAQAQNNCHIPEKNDLQAIVQIMVEDKGFSSGVVIAKDRILTVAHALSGNSDIFMAVNGVLTPATPLVVSEFYDLAMLKVKTGSIEPIAIGSKSIGLNEQVWAIGYPLGQQIRTSMGVVTNKKNSSIYSSAHINSGTSGGGLLRCKNDGTNEYELAGIVKAFVASVNDGVAINTGDSVAVGLDAMQGVLEYDNRSHAAVTY